jgi:ribonuclease BN (tRNA processing enzyme)
VELVVLGSDGTWPRAGGAASGYLLRHDGVSVWIDAGTGTMANLQRYVDVLDVDALVISHAHPDHFVDVYPFYYARLFQPDGPAPLPLFAPPGFLALASSIMRNGGTEDLGRVYREHAVEPGSTFEVGPLRVRTAPMRHPVPTLGMRFEADGASIGYSADTGPTDELIELARGVDLLVAEATMLDATDRSTELHLSGRQAGEHAARADAGSLMLTHLRTDDRDGLRERAASAFDGPVSLAEQGEAVRP